MVSKIKQDSLRVFYWSLLIVLITGLTSIYIFVPQWREHFEKENKFLENLSAMFFLFSFFIGAAAYFNPYTCMKAWFCSFIPIIGLLGFLDEIHFGADWFGFEVIHLWGSDEYIIDGVHDFFTLPFKLWNNMQRGWWDYIISGLIGAFIALSVLKRKSYMPWIMKQVKTYQCFDYFRFAVIFVGIAMIMDLGLFERMFSLGVQNHPVCTYIEELLETLGGVSLCFASLSIHRMRTKNKEL